MKPLEYLTEDELIRRGVDALMQALGPIETARFLRLRQKQRVESVRRHREWQAGLDTDKFLREVFGEDAGTEK
jgi:hypothetical protein